MPASQSVPTVSVRPPAWRSEGTRISDPGAPIPARIDLSAPHRGIVLTDGNAEPDELLGLHLTSGCELVDSWLRGDDVTAVYQSADGRTLRSTAMWRVHPMAAPARSWELVASAQTTLLETHPRVSVVSSVAADEILWAAVGAGPITWGSSQTGRSPCVLLRRRRPGPLPTSILLVAHPADTAGLSVTVRGPRVSVECGLFPEMLEKGVLVRSRLLAAVGPTQHAAAWAERLVAAFLAAPPVLTT